MAHAWQLSPFRFRLFFCQKITLSRQSLVFCGSRVQEVNNIKFLSLGESTYHLLESHIFPSISSPGTDLLQRRRYKTRLSSPQDASQCPDLQRQEICRQLSAGPVIFGLPLSRHFWWIFFVRRRKFSISLCCHRTQHQCVSRPLELHHK